LRAIANPALPMQVFLACAAALRNAAVVRPLGESAHRLPANTEALIVESLGKSKSVDPRVAVAIEMVRAAAGRQERIKINEVAETCRVDTKYLGRLIEEESGFKFTEWRTAFLLRPAVSPLVNTDEDVKQIARNSRAFSDLSQFDHEFRRFFGVCPTNFRDLWRASRR
jgi:AraC-like DNA-binding protein